MYNVFLTYEKLLGCNILILTEMSRSVYL